MLQTATWLSYHVVVVGQANVLLETFSHHTSVTVRLQMTEICHNHNLSYDQLKTKQQQQSNISRMQLTAWKLCTLYTLGSDSPLSSSSSSASSTSSGPYDTNLVATIHHYTTEMHSPFDLDNCNSTLHLTVSQCYFLNNYVKQWPILIISGMQHHDVGLSSAWRKASGRADWHHIVDTATLWKSTP